MDPHPHIIWSGSSSHQGVGEGRNMTRFSSSGFSLGSHLLVPSRHKQGMPSKMQSVFPAQVCRRVFDFFFFFFFVLLCFVLWLWPYILISSLTEEPTGYPEIILKNQIFILETGSRDPTMKVPE